MPTPNGSVRIRALCTPPEILRYTFDNEFTVYDNYKSLYTKRESLEEIAEQPGTNMLLGFSRHSPHYRLRCVGIS